MRILLLAPYLAPYNNPRALRWTAILHAWREAGLEVDVISGRHPDEPATDTSPDGYIQKPAYPSPAARVRPQTGKGRSHLRTAYRYLARSWMWPDDSRFWLTAARRKLRTLPIPTYDALVSVSLPFGPHLLAHELKTKYPHLFWLADIGDPFALQHQHAPNSRLLYQHKNRKAEQSVLESADAVTVTNENCRQLYLRQNWKVTPGQIRVIPPVCSLPEPVPAPTTELTGPLRIGYFGRFSRHIREPKHFLPHIRALQNGNEIQWHFFGDSTGMLTAADTRDLQLTEHPLLASEQLPRAMGRMDILLSLGNNTDYQLPSKVADYLCSRMPILHLCQLPIDRDPVVAILRNHPYAIWVTPQAADLQAVADQLFQLRGKRLSDAQFEQWCRPFSGKAVADAYRTILAAGSAKSQN